MADLVCWGFELELNFMGAIYLLSTGLTTKCTTIGFVFLPSYRFHSTGTLGSANTLRFRVLMVFPADIQYTRATAATVALVVILLDD
ncbi:hypothetical protein Pelo_13794 [Pelomyxa schiedti]|nr:hypothetical protein Pelo_13794 [Pelomyxa schiedti]